VIFTEAANDAVVLRMSQVGARQAVRREVVDGVPAEPCDKAEHVAAGATDQRVIPQPAGQRVVAGRADDRVRERVAGQRQARGRIGLQHDLGARRQRVPAGGQHRFGAPSGVLHHRIGRIVHVVDVVLASHGDRSAAGVPDVERHAPGVAAAQGSLIATPAIGSVARSPASPWPARQGSDRPV